MQHSEKVNILLVDDRPENLLALEAILDQHQMNLVKAHSGEQALRCLLLQDFAIILLDVQMPGMDGFETAKLIRSRKRSADTPIIFLTAIDTSSSRVMTGYELGAVDYLFKPIVPEILRSKVSVFVDLFRKTEEIKQQSALLALTNHQLAAEVAQRQQAETALQQANAQLEITIAQRTEDLRLANQQLLQKQTLLQQSLEQAKELNSLKSRIITTISHEYRTPLTTIQSSADLLATYGHKWVEEKKLTHLERIVCAVKYMTSLLKDVLIIGQAEAGKLEFSPTPLDLTSLCCNLVNEAQITTSKHIITFRSQTNCTQAMLDEKLLRHILTNLLSNAIKYSPSGGIRFDLIGETESAIFRIQDEGIGIPQKDIPQLFDSFSRASNVGTISGTGLGLAIVKKAVDSHCGTITVNSEVGVGTTFIVKLPLIQQALASDCPQTDNSLLPLLPV